MIVLLYIIESPKGWWWLENGLYVLQRGLQPLIFTVRASTIQAVLSFAIPSHWPLCWLEVKKAFLNGLSLTPSSSWDLLAYFDANWAGCPNSRTQTKINWLGHLLQDLKVSSSLTSIKLCYSQSSVFIVVNPVSNKHSKHIDLDRHFVRESVASKKLQIHYVPTNLSITDMFTKSLGRSAFIFLHSKLRI